MTTLKNAICVFDFTCCVEKQEWKKIVEWLNTIAKHWVFQKEKAPTTGYIHWQGRFSLKTKSRTIPYCPDGKCSATSEPASKNFDYVMKEDSRVDGPWNDIDYSKEYVYIQKRFRDCKLNGWQQMLLDTVLGCNSDRKIHVVVDDAGGSGKTFWKGYMMSFYKAKIIPSSMSSAEDMLQALCDMTENGWEGIVIVDLPRATREDYWYKLACALETIKSGILYDKRYHFRQTIIEPPKLMVLCNNEPPEGVFSRDVWNIIRPPGRISEAVNL